MKTIDVGKNLKALRELKGWSQEAMAIELEISQKTYSNIENSRNNISFEKLLKIADILKISIITIIEFNKERILSSDNLYLEYKEQHIIKHSSRLDYEQADFYERIVEEKDKLLLEKDKIIELLESKR